MSAGTFDKFTRERGLMCIIAIDILSRGGWKGACRLNNEVRHGGTCCRRPPPSLAKLLYVDVTCLYCYVLLCAAVACCVLLCTAATCCVLLCAAVTCCVLLHAAVTCYVLLRLVCVLLSDVVNCVCCFDLLVCCYMLL